MNGIDVLGILSYIILFCIGTYYFKKKMYHMQTCRCFELRVIIKAIVAFLAVIVLMRMLPWFKMTTATQIFPIHMLGAFVVLAILSIGLWLFVEWYVKSRFVKIARRKLSTTRRIIVGFLCLMALFLTSGAIWFKAFYGQITPEQFLFNLQSPLIGTSDTMFLDMYFSLVFPVLIGMLGMYLFLSTPDVYVPKRYVDKALISPNKAISFSAGLFVLSILLTVGLLRLDKVVKLYYTSSTYIKNNYVDVRRVQPIFPEEKRNLVHIYLESVENSYFDQSLGGHMSVNLMPELTKLSQEGVHFSHHDKLGGPHQTHGSSWSVASMVNMMSGIPLKVAMGGNDYGKSGYFLPGVYNLGDLLHDNGYEQMVMFGADATFGGLDVYFKDHGNFQVFDVKHARKKGYIPDDYNVWWGFEDDKLFEYAKTEIIKLSNSGKPFHFVMENADTHFPHGYMTDKKEKKHASQYANVIAYTSKQVVEFVRWLQQQPFYSQTTVVITGDHLSMDTEFFENFDPNYKRTVYNLFLNAPIQAKKTTYRQFATVDFYPTILASIGVKIPGERVGLGTNLFSDIPTLIERDGLEHYENELEQNSNFYNEHFVNEKRERKKDFKSY